MSTSEDLALTRTRLAHERTMMAWIRTGTSLISFGFSIYKFFDLQTGNLADRGTLVGPRVYGFSMIFTGLTAIIIAMIEHARSLQSMRNLGLHVPRSLATVIALMVALLGVMGLGAVIFHK